MNKAERNLLAFLEKCVAAPKEETMFYTYLSGRGANGSQGDRGVQIHAIRGEDSYPNFATALCGATPGRRSGGWSEYRSDAVTCPKCAKKLENIDNCVE